MKEVTICFSFSVKDGLAKNALEALDILSGLCIDGIRNLLNRKTVLKHGFKLLEQINWLSDDLSIGLITPSERKDAIPPDDLEAKNTTHAKSYKGE